MTPCVNKTAQQMLTVFYRMSRSRSSCLAWYVLYSMPTVNLTPRVFMPT